MLTPSAVGTPDPLSSDARRANHSLFGGNVKDLLCLCCMQTKEKVKRLPTMKDIQQIKHEVRSLRSFFISMVGEDPEGTYKPEFAKRMREALEEKPTFTYAGRGSLLKQLKKL